MFARSDRDRDLMKGTGSNYGNIIDPNSPRRCIGDFVQTGGDLLSCGSVNGRVVESTHGRRLRRRRALVTRKTKTKRYSIRERTNERGNCGGRERNMGKKRLITRQRIAFGTDVYSCARTTTGTRVLRTIIYASERGRRASRDSHVQPSAKTVKHDAAYDGDGSATETRRRPAATTNPVREQVRSPPPPVATRREPTVTAHTGARRKPCVRVWVTEPR